MRRRSWATNKGENRQPFYVKINKKFLSSFLTDTIAKLIEGSFAPCLLFNQAAGYGSGEEQRVGLPRLRKVAAGDMVNFFVISYKFFNMITINPQYIKDTAGKQLVILPANQFKTIMEELEDLEDIKRYDAAKKRKQSFVDADTAFKQIEAKRKK